MKKTNTSQTGLGIILLTLIILFITNCQKAKEETDRFNYFCEIATEDWQCQVTTKDFEDLIVPDSIDIPEAIIKYTNYSKTISGPENSQSNPSITIFLYRINNCCETRRLKKYLDSQSFHSSCIPIYYGETTPHYIVTSPCLINHGIFTNEANEAIAEMHDALKKLMVKYNKDLIDN